MLQANNVAILEEPQRSIGIVGWFVPPRQDHPVVVFILVVVTGDLLLQRSNGKRLHVGVK